MGLSVPGNTLSTAVETTRTNANNTYALFLVRFLITYKIINASLIINN